MSVYALIPAAGESARMGKINKLLFPLGGKSVLAWTLEIFSRSSLISGIVVAAPEALISTFQEVLASCNWQGKKVKIIEGGLTRQESVFNALQHAAEAEIVAVHDAARPLLTLELLEKVIQEGSTSGAAVLGIPIRDTIKRVSPNNIIETTIPREGIWAVQTPQVFYYSLLKEAHLRARKEHFIGTDDAVLVERLPYKVKMVPGSWQNIKITTSEDLSLAEVLIALNQ
jgi:2-C-methyl-D-erythritol 4-phosphate cytidylyltransferase